MLEIGTEVRCVSKGYHFRGKIIGYMPQEEGDLYVVADKEGQVRYFRAETVEAVTDEEAADET